jgi:hypothetical protein
MERKKPTTTKLIVYHRGVNTEEDEGTRPLQILRKKKTKRGKPEGCGEERREGNRKGQLGTGESPCP